MTYIPEGCDPQLKFEANIPTYPDLEEIVKQSIAHLPPEQQEFILQKVY